MVPPPGEEGGKPEEGKKEEEEEEDWVLLVDGLVGLEVLGERIPWSL